mmetsp:Transcript_98459/g.249924  ORF Transcript_98459/g.249924 Transcript_98459/m.249924 type:complete len:97 (-) Transcript_98459:80-370(-)
MLRLAASGPGSGAPAPGVAVVDCAKQENQSDCGVYVLLFVRSVLEVYLSKGAQDAAGAAASVSAFRPQDAAQMRREVPELIRSEAAVVAAAKGGPT